MGNVGIAKPGFDREDRAVIDTLFLAVASAASEVEYVTQKAPVPSADEIWARGIQILFSTIFTVIVVWLVIKIWKGEIWNDEKKDDAEGK